jgi:hypothetical protein
MKFLAFAFIAALIFNCPAQDKPAAVPEEKAPEAPAGPQLPKEVLDFQGRITGTVESVKSDGREMKVKVSSASADAEKNRAAKPEALSGMSITVTPLEKRQPDKSVKIDEAAVAWIKGAKAGDAVQLEVRASSKGVVFRLLKVPGAAGK